MKNKFLVVISVILLTAGCTKSIRGSGRLVTETRNLPALTGIQLEGDAEVEISKGNVQSVTVSGYENLVPVFLTEVRNGVLILRFADPYYTVRHNNIRIVVVIPDISSIRSNGSGTIGVGNFLGSPNLKAAINGSGNIVISNSSFDKLNLTINGSGNIHAFAADAKEAEAEIHGSGNIELTCLQKIKAHIYGSGNIDYRGSATVTDVYISGSGRVRKR